MTKKNLLTQAAAAREYGVARSRIHDLIRQGRLKIEEIGGVKFVIGGQPYPADLREQRRGKKRDQKGRFTHKE